MPNGLALHLDVDDASLSSLPGEQTCVCSLTASLRVKGRSIEKDIRCVCLAHNCKNVSDFRIDCQLVVAHKLAGLACQWPGKDRTRRTATLPLALHQGGHRSHVDRHTPLLGKLGGQLHREPQGVMQIEHFFGAEGSAVEQPLEPLCALAQGDREPLFLLPHDTANLYGLVAD